MCKKKKWDFVFVKSIRKVCYDIMDKILKVNYMIVECIFV